MADAGWYADPSDPSGLRYWDGASWTHDVGRAADAAAPASGDVAGGEAPSTGAAPDGPPVDLFRYHDLTRRIGVFSPAGGGTHVRGDHEDVVVQDGEVALHAGEVEHARLAGVLRLAGPRSTPNSSKPSVGLVFEGFGTVIVTSTRLIVHLGRGRSVQGQASDDEIHVFVLPWDLVTSIGIPAKRTFSDRVAGGRTIDLVDVLNFIQLTLVPVKKAEIGGQEVRITDQEVMDLLVRAGTTHRLGVSPPSDAARLHAVQAGHWDESGGERVAWLAPPDGEGIPPHLVGRLVEHGPP